MRYYPATISELERYVQLTLLSIWARLMLGVVVYSVGLRTHIFVLESRTVSEMQENITFTELHAYPSPNTVHTLCFRHASLSSANGKPQVYIISW